MTSIPPLVQETELYLRRLADELTRPRVGECLCCYVARLLDDYPCDGSHRHALRYRDALAPRATALLTRLGRVGACCCDCELFLNGYRPRAAVQTAFGDESDGDERAAAAAPPPCAGVRRGSVQPCRNWVRIRRW